MNTNLSINQPKMQFTQVTASKYVGTNGYTLHQLRDGSFSIAKNTVITNWGAGFQSVKAAETFINNHNYILATADNIHISESDLQFIEEAYCGLTDGPYFFEPLEINEDCSIISEYTEDPDGNIIVVTVRQEGKEDESFTQMEPLLRKLDEITNDKIVASAILRGKEFRTILAKSFNRSSREITQNLVRVASSNVWAYGVEIKDNNAKEGDVYVQFKGKNGGPEHIYKYYDVPITLWRKFISAPSKGHFVWKYLRNNFLYSKLTGDKRGILKNAVNH